MTTDKQQQEEELLILKSILGDTITDLSTDNDQFEIDIEFQLPPVFHLRLVDDSNQLSTLIHHLPPLILTVYFHDTYPSSIDSPTFVLSSCYLSREHLQDMCQALDEIWEQNLSQPIVFQWIEYVKERFSSINELCLSNTDINNDNDEPRAMSSYQPRHAAHVYEQLLEYNRERENEKFLYEYHDCPICMSTDISGHDMIRLYKCHHAFCRICLHDYAQMHINTGSVEWLLCPDSQCQLALLPTEIKTIVNNNQLYDKYERLLLQKTLEQMLDVSWCPRCQQAVLTASETDKLGFCNECLFSFCKKCKKTYHSQTLCGHELELAELRKQHRKLHTQMQALNIQPTDEETLLREILAVARVENTTRLCPNEKCEAPIEKNMGCDHMFCTRCHTAFNWSEAKDQISDAKILIDRYENDFARVQKALERERTFDDNEDLAAAKPLKPPVITKLLLQRAKRCPNISCGKFNIKSGTSNYLICQYCKRSFCFACGRAILSVKTHFGQTCKRHSPV